MSQSGPDYSSLSQQHSITSERSLPPLSNAAARSKKKKLPTFLRIFLGELGSPPRCWLTGGSRDQPHSCLSSLQSLHRRQTDLYEKHCCGHKCRVLLLPTSACLAERDLVQMCTSKGSSAEALLLFHVIEACTSPTQPAQLHGEASAAANQADAASLGPGLQPCSAMATAERAGQVLLGSLTTRHHSRSDRLCPWLP